jgi:hypothetical protein
MFSMASADSPTINGTRSFTKTAFEGSLTATLTNGMMFPSASPMMRAAKASRNGSRCGASTQRVHARLRAT